MRLQMTESKLRQIIRDEILFIMESKFFQELVDEYGESVENWAAAEAMVDDEVKNSGYGPNIQSAELFRFSDMTMPIKLMY